MSKPVEVVKKRVWRVREPSVQRKAGGEEHLVAMFEAGVWHWFLLTEIEPPRDEVFQCEATQQAGG